MGFPKLNDLELVVRAINYVPNQTLEMDSHLAARRLWNIDEAKIEVQEMLKSDLGDFLESESGQAHFYDRIGRLERLPEGRYDVAVPESTISLFGKEIVIPATMVSVEHVRAHHEAAMYDAEMWSEDKFEGRFSVDHSEKIAGVVESMINVHLEGRDFSSVYSEFRTKVALPEDWERIQGKFDAYNENDLKAYGDKRGKALNSMRAQGLPTAQLQDSVTREDAEFLGDHRELIEEAVVQQETVRMWHQMAVNRIITEYAKIMQGKPMSLLFERQTSVGVDDHGRLFQSRNLGYSRPLLSADWDAALRSKIESPAFNERFQEEFAVKLKEQPEAPKEYGRKAEGLLYEAFNHLRDGYNSAAVARAAAGFEVALNGFLYERGVITAEDLGQSQCSIRQRMNGLFDEAVAKEDGYQGKTGRVFPRKIMRKLIEVGRSENEEPTFQKLRNIVAHEGGPSPGGNTHYNVAQVACDLYAEATNFILDEGWKQSGALELTSDVMTYLSPELKNSLPRVVPAEAVHTLEKGLRQVMPYMQPMELEWHKRNVDQAAWAYKVLHEK